MKHETPEEQIAHLMELVEGIEYAMLATTLPDGTIRSRPMGNQKLDGTRELWFFTKSSSGKVDEIAADSHVNLSYADPRKHRYVSVSGRGTTIRDTAKMKELWSPMLKAWFPDGLDDPELTLLKVRIDQAEYWDSGTNKMVQLYGLVKALVTGTEYEPGETAKIDLRSRS